MGSLIAQAFLILSAFLSTSSGTVKLFPSSLIASLQFKAQSEVQSEAQAEPKSPQARPQQGQRSGTISTTRNEELRNVAEEDAELDYLYSVHEVGQSDYLLTKGRHFVLKKYLQSLPETTIDLPELFVMTKAEMKDFFHNPPNPERLKNGVELEQHWVYRGKMIHGHTFYIFERH